MADLKSMKPWDAYSEAVRAGIEVAVAHDKVEDWYEKHPDFAAVRELVTQGAQEHLNDLLRRLNEAGLDNVIVVNRQGDGTATSHSPSASEG